MPAYLLIALNKQIYMVVIGVIGICLGLPLNYIFIKIFHLGITGAAVATSITYFYMPHCSCLTPLATIQKYIRAYKIFLSIILSVFVGGYCFDVS